MEKRRSSSKLKLKANVIPAAALPPGHETKMARDTMSSEDDDPRWDELGATRIVGTPGEPPPIGSGSSSGSNFTEISPSRILGKNLVQLGDYQLEKKLGEGAMGAVYKAKHLGTERVVAVKILFPHVANNPKLVKRLQREGRVMGLMDHPNIVQAYEVGESEGCHFIAMEFISGQSMQKWLTQLGRLTVEDAVSITLTCAKALAYAHAQDMIHRDIKPDNILLTEEGVVKLADLGMVKTADEDMSLTQTGHAVGTPWFMPLEQARNAKEIDGRSDIYALGCTLYAFLTGLPPFTGRTIVEVIQAKDTGTFPPARQSNRNIPERLDLIIAKMTAKLPKYRYQTCAELIKDLESLQLAGKPLSFLHTTIDAQQQEDEAVARMDATLTGAIPSAKAKTSLDTKKTELDPDSWYLRVKTADGKITTKKYSTSQLENMLADGKIKPSVQISHHPKDGFRALATFKEFQGAVLSEASKKAVDKSTARYRGMYKKIEEEDRQREEEERAKQKEETQVRVNTRYWLGIFLAVLPIGLLIVFLLVVVMWLASR